MASFLDIISHPQYELNGRANALAPFQLLDAIFNPKTRASIEQGRRTQENLGSTAESQSDNAAFGAEAQRRYGLQNPISYNAPAEQAAATIGQTRANTAGIEADTSGRNKSNSILDITRRTGQRNEDIAAKSQKVFELTHPGTTPEMMQFENQQALTGDQLALSHKAANEQMTGGFPISQPGQEAARVTAGTQAHQQTQQGEAERMKATVAGHVLGQAMQFSQFSPEMLPAASEFLTKLGYPTHLFPSVGGGGQGANSAMARDIEQRALSRQKPAPGPPGGAQSTTPTPSTTAAMFGPPAPGPTGQYSGGRNDTPKSSFMQELKKLNEGLKPSYLKGGSAPSAPAHSPANARAQAQRQTELNTNELQQMVQDMLGQGMSLEHARAVVASMLEQRQGQQPQLQVPAPQLIQPRY